MDYGFKHDGKVYTPNGTVGITPEENDARNAAIQEAELAHWKTQPARQLVYYKLPADAREYFGRSTPVAFRGEVTTWKGAKLGTITHAHVYQHNFGSRFISIQVMGTNGAEYYGRASYDCGDCIWLRKRK